MSGTITFIPNALAELAVDVDLTGEAEGAILYRGASKWLPLPAGTSGQILTTNGAGAAPTWEDAPAGGGGGVTDHGALTGLADDDHTQYHTDARGDARYLQLSGGTLTGATTFSSTLRAQGGVTESALGIDRIDMGVQAGSPRMVFENSGFTIWEIDNDNGNFRIFNPGAVRLQLASTLFTLNVAAQFNNAIATHSAYLASMNGRTQFAYVGAGTNDANQDAIRIQPSGALSTYWRPLAVYLTSGATTPAMCIDRKGAVIATGHRTTPQSLTDASSIATDASLGDYFRVTLGGNRTLAAPTNPTDGQTITWELLQDATGGRTLTLDTGTGGFKYGTDLTALVLSTTAGARDLLRATYISALGKWCITGFMRGF